MSRLQALGGQSYADSDLVSAVQEILGRHLRQQQPIASLAHRPSSYRTSFALEEIDVRLHDGAELRLMLKDTGPHALSAASRAVKPSFLFSPLREIEVYRRVLATDASGTPVFYGARVDPAQERYWLLLERVSGKELYQIGDLTIWQEAARWLAAFHERYPGVSRSAWGARDVLVRYDEDFYRCWMRRAVAFAQHGDASYRRSIDRLRARYDDAVVFLASLPRTLIHGEFYASNVLVDQEAGGVRVAPVDWEVVGIAPALVDLAALIAGRWSPSQRTAIARAYYESGPVASRWRWDEFQRVLDHCRLHIAVQWLGWSAEWSPPREQGQDWLGEALHLAESLGL